jgi:hypothetical protein
VSDSGEGRWTIKAAIDEAVPVLDEACQGFAPPGGWHDPVLAATESR